MNQIDMFVYVFVLGALFGVMLIYILQELTNCCNRCYNRSYIDISSDYHDRNIGRSRRIRIDKNGVLVDS